MKNNISHLVIFSIILLLPIFLFASDAFQQPSKIGSEKADKSYLVSFDSTAIDSFLMNAMNQYDFPGLAATIVKGSQIIFKGAYGYADIEHNRMVSDSTLFDLASVSKTVTGTAIMQLWENGFFGLDEDINNYLPFQVRNPNHPNTPITFRMLLTHTSSISDNWNILNQVRIVGGDSPISLDSFLVNYLVPGGVYFSSINYYPNDPGLVWNYTGVGVAIIGYLCERLSNMSFEQYCQDHIFVPLGMNETSWFLANLDTNNIAVPYIGTVTNYIRYGHHGWPIYPATTLRSSSLQLSCFLSSFIRKGIYNGVRILDSTTVNLMTTVQNPSIRYNQGLIWQIVEEPLRWFGNRNICYHLGGIEGVSAIIGYILDTEENVGVVVLANNRDDDGITEIGKELLVYGLLHEKIYANNVTLNSTFMRPNEDTLIVNTEFVNPNNHNFSSTAVITSVDSIYNDSIPLFDDGNHGDLQAGDGIWGNFIPPLSDENEFMIGISTTDLDSGDYFILHDLTRFTTVGPVVLESVILYDGYSIGPFYRVPIKLLIRNDGATATAENIRVYLKTSNPRVVAIENNNQNFGNIAAGQSILSPDSFIIRFQNPEPIEHIVLHIDFSSDGYVWWQDSTDIPVGIKHLDVTVPLSFDLKQNYPNPFNPSTTIQFDLPKTSQVTLKVFNILGEEVTILVSDRLSAGSYSYEWSRTGGIASGVYLYRLQAGVYVQTRKMILMK